MIATPNAQSSVPELTLTTLRQVLTEMEATEPERGHRWHRGDL